MKKNSVLNSIKILVLCLVIGLFVGVAFVQAAPPANNVPGPLNVGPSYQNKTGSLDVGSFSTPTTSAGLLRVEKGFRSMGPGIFDDVVVIGPSSGGSGSKTGGTSTEPKKLILQNKNEGFFAKLSNFLGLNTEKALADVVGAGNVETGGITPLGSCNPACTGYSTCQLVSAPNNYACILPECTLNCTTGNCTWGSNGMYCEGTAPVGGGVVGPAITPIELPTYHLTVNGRSTLNGYSKVEGDLDVAGAITSGGKNVCLQDGTNCVSQSTTSNRFWGIFTVKGGASIPQSNGSSNCLRVNPISNFCGCSTGTHSLIASYYNFSTLSHQPGGYNGGTEYKLLIPNGILTPDDFTNHNPNGGLLIAPSGLQREEVYMCTN